MANAGNLCTTIIGDLGRGDASLSDTVLIDIQSSIREYESQRFYFNEQLLTATLSNTDTYALAIFAASGNNVSDLIEIDQADIIINSTRKYRLEELNFGDWLRLSANASGITGYPQVWSVYGQSLKIYPQANGNYTCELWAHVKFTPIQNDDYAASNPWTNDASDLIRNAALKRLWGRRFQNPEAAQSAAVMEDLALKALRKRDMSSNQIPGYL